MLGGGGVAVIYHLPNLEQPHPYFRRVSYQGNTQLIFVSESGAYSGGGGRNAPSTDQPRPYFRAVIRGTENL